MSIVMMDTPRFVAEFDANEKRVEIRILDPWPVFLKIDDSMLDEIREDGHPWVVLEDDTEPERLHFRLSNGEAVYIYAWRENPVTTVWQGLD